MANQQLIQMAADIGKSKGFNDGFMDAAENIQKWADKAETQIKERRAKKEKADARVADYMEKLPSSKDLPKVPPYAQAAVGKFLKERRDEYANHARAIRDLDPQDKEYQDHVEGMNSITSAFDKLDSQFSTLLENKVEYMKAVDNQEVSYGNKPEDLDFLSTVYTDATDMGFTEDGSIIFNNEGNTLGLDELPQWTEVNNKIPAALTKLSVGYYRNGTEISGPMEKTLKAQIENLIKSGGRAALTSLAADDVLGADLGVPDELLHDPEKTTELTDLVVNNWLESIKEHALQGKNQKEAEYKEKHPPKVVKPKNSLDTFFELPVDPAKQ